MTTTLRSSSGSVSTRKPATASAFFGWMRVSGPSFSTRYPSRFSFFEPPAFIAYSSPVGCGRSSAPSFWATENITRSGFTHQKSATWLFLPSEAALITRPVRSSRGTVAARNSPSGDSLMSVNASRRTNASRSSASVARAACALTTRHEKTASRLAHILVFITPPVVPTKDRFTRRGHAQRPMGEDQACSTSISPVRQSDNCLSRQLSSLPMSRHEYAGRRACVR